MKDFKVVYFFNTLLRIVMTVCITWAAIYFDRISILWFYLIPFFTGVEYKGDKGKEDTI